MEGNKFINAFVHYRPSGWDWKEEGWIGLGSATNFQGAPHSFFKKLEHEHPHANAPPHPLSVLEDRLITFTNRASEPRDLWWQGGDGNKIFQATVPAGGSVEVLTTDGHDFFWTTVEDHSQDTDSLRGLRVGKVHKIESHLH